MTKPNVSTMGRHELEFYTRQFLEHYCQEVDTLATLRVTAQKAITYRESKGFTAATWGTIPIKLACIMCEIEELTDALRDSDRVDTMLEVANESADVGMYTLTTLSDLFGEKWTIRERYHLGAFTFSHASDLTHPLRHEARKAFENWRRNRPDDVMICLELELAALLDLRVRVLGFNRSLSQDIERKIQASADRPKLHGGKDPRS